MESDSRERGNNREAEAKEEEAEADDADCRHIYVPPRKVSHVPGLCYFYRAHLSKISVKNKWKEPSFSSFYFNENLLNVHFPSRGSFSNWKLETGNRNFSYFVHLEK